MGLSLARRIPCTARIFVSLCNSGVTPFPFYRAARPLTFEPAMSRKARRAARNEAQMPSAAAKPLPPAPAAKPIPREAPDHAAQAIWAEGDWIYVQLATAKGNTQTLSFACTAAGSIALMRFLHTRANAARCAPTELSRFATPAIPIQHMIDALHRGAIADPEALHRKAEAARARADRERFANMTEREKLAHLDNLLDDLL